MGNSTGHIFDKHNWQFVSKPSTFDIVQDQKTGIHAQKHIIPNNPTISQHDQMEVYRYRNLTNKPIVKVYDAQYVENKAGGACGAAKDIVVHTQHIPHRLSDTKNLNHGQGLYVLSQALAGFHQLHYRFGPFQITDDHIGFNQIGQTKVWHSPNFASNHLDRDNIILMSTANPKNFDQRMEKRQEQQMVEDIWMAVDQHTNFSHDFTSRANSFREKNFVEARQIVAEEILRGTTYVPQYLNFDGVSQHISTARRFTAQSHVQPVNIHTNAPVTSTSNINVSSPVNTRTFRTVQSNIISHPVGQTHYNISQPTLAYQGNNPVYQSNYAVSGNLPPRQVTTINKLDPFVHTTPVSGQYSGQYIRSQQTLPVITQQSVQQNYTVDPRYQTTTSAYYNQQNKVYSNNSNLNVANQTNVGNYGQRENVYLA